LTNNSEGTKCVLPDDQVILPEIIFSA